MTGSDGDLAPGRLLRLTSNERWYVVRSLPQREHRAAEQLRNQGFVSFVPLYWKQRRHARKIETITAPLFPRYMFVVLDLARDRWRSVNGTVGVERLLMRAGEPEPVPRGWVEHLAALVGADGVVNFRPSLRPGQRITITTGPFADLVAELERLDEAGRVRVLLEIMGGKTPVWLSTQQVAPAPY